MTDPGTSAPLAILVYGAGAVGSYYGGRWAAAGHRVTFVARGEHLEVLRTRGLRIESVDGDLELGPQEAVATVPARPYDLVVLAVKAYDTENALAAIAPAVGPETWILSLQNGVDNEERIAARYGAERTVGGIAFIGSERVGPGHVRHTAAGHVLIGPWTPAQAAEVRRLAARLATPPVVVRYTDTIRAALWHKLMWNAAFNTTTCLAGVPAAALLETEAGERLVRAAMAEVIAVAAAEGIRLTQEQVDAYVETTRTMGTVRTSMLVDREHGRRLEVEAISGAVVHRGRRHGVPTPIQETLYALLEAYDRSVR